MGAEGAGVKRSPHPHCRHLRPSSNLSSVAILGAYPDYGVHQILAVLKRSVGVSLSLSRI